LSSNASRVAMTAVKRFQQQSVRAMATTKSFVRSVVCCVCPSTRKACRLTYYYCFFATRVDDFSLALLSAFKLSR
jgi:hypothetical protein